MNWLHWYWPIWLFVILPITFAVPEFVALHFGGLTLSRWTVEVAMKWPLFILLEGIIIGILAAHFYWPWAASPWGPGGG